MPARDALARGRGARRSQPDVDAERDRGVTLALLRQLSWPELRHHPWRNAAGARVPIRIVGIDALVVARVAPALLPRPRADAGRFAVLDPDAVFLNAAAERRLGIDATTLALQTSAGRRTLRIAGTVAAGGPPLAVVDIAGAQPALGLAGRLSRID